MADTPIGGGANGLGGLGAFAPAVHQRVAGFPAQFGNAGVTQTERRLLR